MIPDMSDADTLLDGKPRASGDDPGEARVLSHPVR